MTVHPIGRRAYFVTGAKNHLGQFEVINDVQTVWIPMFPDNAVEEVLPYLDPFYAHYARFWPRIMLDEQQLDEGGSCGFYVSGNLPALITDPSNEPALTEIARRRSPDMARAFGEHLRGLITWDAPVDRTSLRDLCVGAAELGITAP